MLSLRTGRSLRGVSQDHTEVRVEARLESRALALDSALFVKGSAVEELNVWGAKESIHWRDR